MTATRFRIGEFSRMSNVPAKTLRFYDEIGLFRPHAVDARSGYRLYSVQQLRDIAVIVHLKKLGLSLTEIARFVRSRQSTKAARILQARRENLSDALLATEQSLKEIDAALAWLETRGDVPAIVIKQSAAMQIASIRARVSRYNDVEAMQQRLHDSLGEGKRDSISGVLWHSCADAGVLEAEPFVHINDTGSRGEIRKRELPAATLACAYSPDSETDAESAYEAIRDWMGLNGFVLAGPKRELVLGGMLEIQFPLRAA
jgi:DNA-binding transcriptional MerR regulator